MSRASEAVLDVGRIARNRLIETERAMLARTPE